MAFLFAQVLTGLANAASLFLIASGLSLIFGVTRIVNFAHGSLYMLGAYLAVTLVPAFGVTILGFWGGVLAAAVCVALVGVAMEALVLRRLRHAPELFQLVATFGLVLVIQDAALWIWGPEDILGPRAPGLDRAVRIWGEPIPEYDLALIAIGPAVLGLLWLVLHRTRWGVLLRAAAEDREMASALGLDERRLFAGAFALGAFLAGLGGALQIPREAASLSMDLNVIAEAFVVVVIGGMGSVGGAFAAAVLISVLNAFAVLYVPQLSLVLPFLVMGVVLAVRPRGLFGRPHGGPEAHGTPEPPLRPMGAAGMLAVAAGAVALAAAPVAVSGYGLVLLTDLLALTLFAVSLHLLMGVGGMASFGHAMVFGLGAYAAALATARAGLPMPLALALGPVAGALGGALIGVLCLRLSGVYLAMLTLAGAQVVWGVAMQWQDVTGGDDGVLGVWPADWASGDAAFFWLALALCGGGVWAVRRAAFAPFGLSLRAARDGARRAEAIGIHTARVRLTAFALSGAAAGLAGAVFAFAKGSVFPDALSIATSVDALVMVLLGGVQALSGPILGAAAFVLIEDQVLRLEHWRAIFGALILFIVLVAPDGIAGGLARLVRRARR